MILETQTIFALMSLATQMIFALMIQKTTENQTAAGVPPSPASTAKKRPSKITDEMVANIKWLAEMPVSFRDIQRKYFPQLSVQSISLVARYGHVPSTQQLLDLLAEQRHLTQRQVTPAGNRNLGLEIEQYEPAPRGAFNSGLGAGQNRAVLAKAVRDTRKYNKVEYTKTVQQGNNIKVKKLKEFQAFCHEQFGLQKLLNEKSLAPIPNRCRQLIRDKWQEMKLSTRGHEGTYDSIATICLSIIRQAGPEANKLKLKDLVDAAFHLHFPEKLATPYQQLRCKHCRTVKGFMLVKDQAICLKCGTSHPNKPELFKMVVPKINPEYEAVIRNALKSRGGPSTPAVEEPAFSRPSLTPLQSRNGVELASTKPLRPSPDSEEPDNV